MLPCSLFWQVNRIEEMTSVIPSMLTTACWIQRPMNAGRSLLLTHSGTIGTTSPCFKIKLLPNSYQNSMEIRKLICFAVITLISLKQRCSDNFLKQLPQPRSAFSMSYFYVKNPCSFCCILFHRTSVLFSYQKLKCMGFFFFFSSLGFQLNISLWYMHLSLRTEGMHLNMQRDFITSFTYVCVL